MALVIWQSFVLVCVFGSVVGRVMADRAELSVERIERIPFGKWLPHEVNLGEDFLEPAPTNEPFPRDADYRIFPWAVLSWTVQVFFFSAIFERIMQRRTE